LFVGVFVPFIPMCGLEYRAMSNRTFFWKGFSCNMPKWVMPTVRMLGVFFVIHFVLFLVQSHAVAPEINDGQFVLNDHGTIKKLLTESEYLWLKGAELRLFVTGCLCFYFVPMAYWWFPRD
jgi:hypothetical protein